MFKKKKPVIKFASISPFLDLPSPAKKHVPEWYKKATRFLDGRDAPYVPPHSNKPTNLGLKLCVPFLDGLTTGYMATLWQDVLVRRDEDGVTQLTWPVKPDAVNGRPDKGYETLPVPHGHDSKQYVWIIPFVIKTPPGYSLLAIHPLNRFDLPFTTVSAVVDADGVMQSGHLPFFLKEGFEVVIKAGTPLFQIIPFKREDWTSEEDKSLEEADKKASFLSNRTLMGYYKNTIWSKKTYD